MLVADHLRSQVILVVTHVLPRPKDMVSAPNVRIEDLVRFYVDSAA